MRLLNVGSAGSRDVPIIYSGWEQDTLDIDPNVNPDIVCDARQMRTLPPAKYDAVYCSHTLEHFFKHEVPTVLAGFSRVLKSSGFAHVAVPNMNAVFEALVKGNRDINETWYVSPGGPISFHDVIYGWGKQVALGNLYYCHKTGFTEKSLAQALRVARFVKVMTACDDAGNLYAFAFKATPSRDKLRGLGL
jgi:hypothetical protein